MSQSLYRKLPGRGRTWGGTNRVWLANDHLLLVLARGYYEHYRRFFFNDIQGIVLQRTHTGKIWNAVWGVLFALLILPSVPLFVEDNVAGLVLLCVALPFGVAVIANLALGPTCACYIRTAVQTERLPAVSRLRAAEQFMTTVEPLILAAQGELPREKFTTELALLQSGQLARANEPPPSNTPPVIS